MSRPLSSDVAVIRIVGNGLGLLARAYVNAGARRVRRALPEMPRVLLYGATLVVSAVYGMAERTERRRGERR